MARLPDPGGDDSVWGTVLNDYLLQSHKADGSLKNDLVGASQIQDGSITNVKIASGAAISADKLADGSTSKVMTAAERTKLSGLTGKLADASDLTGTNAQVGKVITISGVTSGLPSAFALGRASRIIDPTDYGAVGNGSNNDTTALTAAIAALTTGDTLWIAPNKIYTHTTVLTVATDGVRITGGGEIRATAENTSAFILTGNHIVIEDIKFTCPTTTTRGSLLTHHKLQLQGNTGCILRRVTIDGSAAAGFFAYGASNYQVDSCYVTNTRADAYHNVKASNYGLFTNCDAYNVGDDGYAAVSYATGADAGKTHHIRFYNCKVINTTGGRMFSCVGASNIEFDTCFGDGSHAAGIIVTTEIAFQTYSVDSVLIRNMEIRNANTLGTGRPDHGAVIVSCERDGTTITKATIRNVRITDTDAVAATRQLSVVETGTGVVGSILFEDMKIYGTGPSQMFYTNVTASKYSLVDVKGSGSWGWELLASLNMSAAANSTGAIAFSPRKELMVVIRVQGIQGGDIPALRFNGDTGNDYSTRFLTAAAGGATLADVPVASTSQLRLSGITNGGLRQHTLFIANHKDWPKVATIQSALESGGAGGTPALDVSGTGTWAITNAQISSIELRTVGGINMNDNTSIMIFGRDI
jgi:hypothetical protein